MAEALESINQNFAEIPLALERDRLLYLTIQELFSQIEEDYKCEQDISDESLKALDAIFGETLEKALELVDSNCVKYCESSAGSFAIFQVEGSLCSTYTIFPCINYCPCPAFKYQVAGGSNVTCKHVLASNLAKILGKAESVSVTPFELRKLLLASAGLDDYNRAEMNKKEGWPTPGWPMEPFMYPQSEVPPTYATPDNWTHIPPQTMPWGLPTNPPLVRFTAGDYVPVPYPAKRKSNSEFDLPRPPKVMVTEEKMAAHMSNLHISDVPSQVQSQPPPPPMFSPKDEESMETDRLPRLVISEELKNLRTEPIIPESMLSSIERPKMAVVLWKPPTGKLGDLGTKLAELRKEEEKDVAKDEEMKMMEDTMLENNNVADNATFRPIDPVPMMATSSSSTSLGNPFHQPTPQFHGYFPFT